MLSQHRLLVFKRYLTISSISTPLSSTIHSFSRSQSSINLPDSFISCLESFDCIDAVKLRNLAETNQIVTTLSSKQLRKVLKMNQAGLKFPKHMVPVNESIIPERGPPAHLVRRLNRTGGRNHTGRITVRHRGGGDKRILRVIDFSRRSGDPSTVIRIEKDPLRTANLALVESKGKLSYMLAPDGLVEGTTLLNNGNTPGLGESLSLSKIPIGSFIHNIELQPGKGGKLVRAAGTRAVLEGFDPTMKIAFVLMPSKKRKTFDANCRATIGQIGNISWASTSLRKAGVNRRRGFRPTVRGVAMNPVDHPHGGGKGGRSKGHHSQSPWGKICK